MIKKPKIFILDTNVILHDSSCINQFQENDVVIPLTVLEELDQFKRGSQVINLNAREFSRTLDSLTGQDIFNGGVSMGEGRGQLRIAISRGLSPEIKEEIIATLEVLDTFKITKVGTVAGCMVKEGKIKRDTKIRVIREGIVVYTGELGSLKRFKDDAKEVASGLECGLNVENFNDIKVGDIIEGYEIKEIKKKL